MHVIPMKTPAAFVNNLVQVYYTAIPSKGLSDILALLDAFPVRFRDNWYLFLHRIFLESDDAAALHSLLDKHMLADM
jgi:hypothetical protein